LKINPFQKKKGDHFQKLNRSKILHCFIAGIFLCFAVSCGGGTPPPPPAQKGKGPSAEKQKVEPVQVAAKAATKEPGKKDEPEYTYNPVGKPDPFKPFIQLTPQRGQKSAYLTPLQKFEVSQLKLVAVITIPEGNIALVEDSLGKGYFLRKGTVVGKNDGKVKTILIDRVIIEEVFQDIFGQTKMNQVSLFLHRLEEGGEL